jgi:DNA-binding transcriptional LysR family regulator
MATDLDTGLLRAFVAVVRAGSINRAASLLARTQPALSQQIRKLEDHVGQTLLQRSPRGIVPTLAGAALLPYAERILALTVELAPGCGADTQGEDVHYRIGLIEDIVGARLVTVLSDCVAAHPRWRLSMTVAPTLRLGELLAAGELDLIVADPAWPLGLTPRWQLSCPLAWAGLPTLDLTAPLLPLVLFAAPCLGRDISLACLQQAGLAWRCGFESSNLQAVQVALQAGLGIGVLLPGTLPSGVQVLHHARLPALPAVQLALFARDGADPGAEQLSRLFYREISALALSGELAGDDPL